VTHTGGELNGAVTFTWNVTGTKAISVTATNAGGAVSDQARAMKPPNTNRSSTKGTRLPCSVLEVALDAWGRAGQQHLIPISGRSMLPAIHDGDHALVSHGCAGVRPGDVIVFRHTGTLIAHRVLRIERGDDGPTFVTKGDNAPQFDPRLSADEIVGRVLAIERGGRHTSLDTGAWRILGWLIAVSTLAWTRLYGWCQALKQRLLGPQPNRVTSCVVATLRRGALHGLHGTEADSRIAELLDLVGLSEHADHRFMGYSTGMRQKLAVARGLLSGRASYSWMSPRAASIR
jgi:signal peptidase I